MEYPKHITWNEIEKSDAPHPMPNLNTNQTHQPNGVGIL